MTVSQTVAPLGNIGSSRSDVAGWVSRLAGVLLDEGLGQGDVLAVQLPNTVELAGVYLAAWRIGVIVSPLPVQYREHEIVELANLAGVAAFVTAARIGDRPDPGLG